MKGINKKNIKIIIAVLVALVVIVGIVLGVTIRPGNNAGDTAKSTNTTADSSADVFDMQQGDELSQLAAIAAANGTNPDGSTNANGQGGAVGQGAPAGVGNANGETSGQFSSGSASGNSGAGSQSASGGNSISSNGSTNYADGNINNTPVSITCTIAIDCSSISGNGALTAAGNPQLEPYAVNPYILAPTVITVSDSNGDGRVGVDEAIKQACNTYGIQYEFKGSNYLKGMNYLYEFNAGPNSGWMYKVNGRIPNKGCNTYYLGGSEDILWYYVISY